MGWVNIPQLAKFAISLTDSDWEQNSDAGRLLEHRRNRAGADPWVHFKRTADATLDGALNGILEGLGPYDPWIEVLTDAFTPCTTTRRPWVRRTAASTAIRCLWA